MSRLLRWIGVVATTSGVAFTVFWLLVRLLRPGWVSHEYGAIAVWSLPLGFLVLLTARPLRTRFLDRPLLRGFAALLAALLASIAWTFLAVALTGGYALAFDANPLWCWTAASLAGVAVDLRWPRRRDEFASSREAAI
jgi:hypothetical protein